MTGVAQADKALVVNFSPPGTPDDNKITGYTATCTASDASTHSATGTSSPIVVGGLTNGTAYTCTVRATNPIGDGPESAPSASTVPANPPPSKDACKSGTGYTDNRGKSFKNQGDCVSFVTTGGKNKA